MLLFTTQTFVFYILAFSRIEHNLSCLCAVEKTDYWFYAESRRLLFLQSYIGFWRFSIFSFLVQCCWYGRMSVSVWKHSCLEHLVVRLFMLKTNRNDCRTLLISNLSTMFSSRHWVQINRATRQECGLRRSGSKIKRQNPTAHHRAVEILGDG